MTDQIMHWAEQAMASPWIYLALFLLAMIDAFFPVVPSESLVVTAGVFAAQGSPNIALVIITAAAGAFVGDHISYAIGRNVGARLLDRVRPGTKRRAAYEWAAKAIADRGGLILVVARYVPGGRTAVTLVMGSIRFRLRSFSFFDAIAALSWGIYASLIGYLGGKAFEESPIKGLLLGLGIAVGITLIVEGVRHLRERRKRTARGASAGSDDSARDDDPAPDTDDSPDTDQPQAATKSSR